MPQTKEEIAQVEKIVEKITHGPLDRLAIVALHFELDLLEYIITPKLGWKASAAPKIGAPICAFPGCSAGWREGLINHALPSYDPVWYCNVHAPDYQANGVSPPPSSLVPRGPLIQRAKEMVKTWTAFLIRLEKEETTAKTNATVEEVPVQMEKAP